MCARDRVGRRTLLGAVGAPLVALAGCLDATESSESDLEPDSVTVDTDAAWRTATLEDATGESISLSAIDGPTVVHTFSTGCAACQTQHRAFDAITPPTESLTIVDLSIDPNDDPERLRAYAAEAGYSWHFVVAPDAVTFSLVDDFGQAVTSSAASPVIVDCGGETVSRLDKVVDSDAMERVLADRCL